MWKYKQSLTGSIKWSSIIYNIPTTIKTLSITLPRVLKKNVQWKNINPTRNIQTLGKMLLKLYIVHQNILLESDVIIMICSDNDYDNFKNHLLTKI